MANDIVRLKERADNLKKYWEPRDTRIKDERDFLNLPQPKVIKKGFINIVLNEPKVLYDTSVSLISGFPPRFRLPIHAQVETEKVKMNKAERFLTGVLREVESRQLARGRDRWTRELAWYLCGGWYAVFVFVDTDEDDNPVFRWEIFDPLTIYPRWGLDKLTEVARIFYMEVESAYNMAKLNGWKVPDNFPAISEGVGTAGNNIQVTNYWWLDGRDVYNCVWLGDMLSKDITQHKEFKDEIPMLVGPVGGSPVRATTESDKGWIKYIGEGVITTNRGMFEQQNKLVSLMMQVVQDTAYPNLLDYTRTGAAKLKPEDLGSGKVHHRQIGEIIEVLKHASTPNDVNVLLNLIGQGVQRGGLPYAIYGNIPFELSGFALSQLIAGMRHKLNPYMFMFNRIIAECGLQTMRLYKQGDFKPVDLVVSTPKGDSFTENFDPNVDIPDVRFVEVETPLAVPLDKNQLLAAIRQAVARPQILSRETVWDTFPELGVDDKEVEYERIMGDEMMDDPVVKKIHYIEKFRQEAEKWETKNKVVSDRIKKYADLLENQLMSVLVEKPPKEEVPGLPGGAIPPERLGESRAAESMMEGKVPPMTLKSEMTGVPE